MGWLNRRLAGWRAAARVGVVLGFTIATKFTGWLAWVPVAMSHVVQKTPPRFYGLA